MPKNHKDQANVRHSTLGLCVTAVVSLAATLILTASGLEGATTVDAKSASQSDVAAAIASAADGDTVTIPGGTATWTRTLPVRKAITLQGSGVGVTIIKDGVQTGQLILITLAANNLTRLTGIELQDGGRVNNANAPGGIIQVNGSNTNGSRFRWDHCKWVNLNGFPVFNTVIGVIDHNEYIQNTPGHGFMHYVYDSLWDGGTSGDASWAAPTNFGSDQFLFIEDCTFTQNLTNIAGATDGFAGSRFVIRHCTLHRATINNHGTESGGRERGGRVMEIYNNTIDLSGTGHNSFGGFRSGTGVIYNNTITGTNSPKFDAQNYRNFFPFRPWLGADGTNQWDLNDPTVYFTGTASANSSGTTVTVSGSPGWATNQWVAYTIRRTSNVGNSNSVTYAWITASGSNSITYTGNAGYGGVPNLNFSAGDTLEIRKVIFPLDAPGRARGSVVTGGTPVPPAGRNDQVTEPIYSWNNGANFTVTSGPGVRDGVQVINNTQMPGYTPYTYPHPLTKGFSPSEQTTRNATANSQRDAHKKRRPWGGKKPERKQAKKAKEGPTNEIPEGQENVDN